MKRSLFSRMIRPLSIVVGLAAPIVACSSESTGSGGGTGGSGGGTSDGLGGAAGTAVVDASAPFGLFVIELKAEADEAGTVTPASTSLTGWVKTAAPNPQRIWEVTQQSGGCILQEPYAPFCEVDCGSGTCVDDGVCKDQPVNLDPGTVSLAGIQTAEGSSSVDLVGVMGLYQFPAAVTVAYPPAAEGATITLTADGEVSNPALVSVGGFTLEVPGIAPLEITSGAVVPMERDVDTVVTWAPPARAEASRIFVEVDISHHGGQKGQINCEVDDTGSATIPAALVTALINLGVAGYPVVSIERRATTTTTLGSGDVQLWIKSGHTLDVEIPGIISCTPADNTAGVPEEPCPDGFTCNDLTRLCE